MNQASSTSEPLLRTLAPALRKLERGLSAWLNAPRRYPISTITHATLEGLDSDLRRQAEALDVDRPRVAGGAGSMGSATRRAVHSGAALARRVMIVDAHLHVWRAVPNYPNPAVTAVEPILNRPLFFEVHRLGVFTPRSLDVDVIYDLMIHDLDILLAMVGESVVEVKAVGIPVLTEKVDIAHARLEFAGGAVANITASRVSTERVRKMRFFQQHEYISLDYARRDALRIGVKKPGPQPEFGFEKLNAPAVEPLHAELEAFVNASRSRKEPRTNGAAGRAALELATRVMASIQEHAARVQIGSFATQDKTR